MLNRRDRAVVGGLSLALVVLVLVIAWPAVRPSTAVVASPTPDAVPTRPYREGILGRPTTVSPFGARTAADRALVALVFAGLARLGPGETLIPDLASGWTVDGTGGSYTFTIRPDARWHDGIPVTSADVAFTIRSLQDPGYTGPGSASWRDVTVTPIDELTVRFDLANPIGGFLTLATQPIAPAHLLEGIPPSELPVNPFGQQPIGAGQYRLVSWNAGEATLEVASGEGIDDGPVEGSPPVDALESPSPTPTPARPRPYIGRIELTFMTDPSELRAAFRAGRVDVVSGLAPSDAAELAESTSARLLRYPRSTLTTVLFDQRTARPEFHDARTRLGLLTAIDRDRIVVDELVGLATRADAPIPPASWAFDEGKSPPVAHDAEAAEASLVAAGWNELDDGGWSAPGGTEAYALELLTPDEASNPVSWAIANAVAGDWEALGFEVEIVGVPTMTYVERLRGGDFAAAVVDLGIGLDPDLYPFLASTQTIAGGPNVSGIQDPQLDTKLVAARQPGPDATRIAAYADLQAYLATNVYLAPIAWRDEAVVASREVSGPTVRRLGEAADRYYDVLAWRLADDR